MVSIKKIKFSNRATGELCFGRLSHCEDKGLFCLFSALIWVLTMDLLPILAFDLYKGVNLVRSHLTSFFSASEAPGRALQFFTFDGIINLAGIKGTALFYTLTTFLGLDICDFTLYLQTNPVSRALAVMTFSVALHQKDATELWH